MKGFDEIYNEICNEYHINSNSNNNEITMSITIKQLLIATLLLFLLNILSELISILKIIFMIYVIFYLYILMKFMYQYHKKIEHFRKLKKAEYKKIINKLIENYSKNLNYYPQEGISLEEYEEAKFKGDVKFSSEDLITGNILNNCFIKMSEVHLYHEYYNKENGRQIITTYAGLFAKITLPYDTNISLRIQKNKAFSDIFKNENKLDMDSTEFEKIYDVLNNDRITTFRILTSDIMQKILDFKDKYKNIPEFVLSNNTLYIRFNVGGVFEPNLENNLDKNTIEKAYNLINFIFEMIEMFSKNIIQETT